jgi:sugar fermentation stimulation protein A
MRFATPLIPATLVRRYKRFLADVILPSGEEITAHVANPGAMTGLATPGTQVWLSKSDDPKRKLPYAWELAEVDFGGGSEFVGVNTAYPNRLVHEALIADRIPECAGYPSLRREVRYGENSRVDFLLEGVDRPVCYLEVKNVHLMRAPSLAEFPNSVTARGARHMQELAAMAGAGARAAVLFLIQIGSATRFAPAADIDPAYAASLEAARARGVEALAYTCAVTTEGIVVDRRVPIVAASAG